MNDADASPESATDARLSDEQKAALRRRLYGGEEARFGVYAILDGASIPDLPAALQRLAPEHLCLYRGELGPEMTAAAPYLVKLPDDGGDAFCEFLLDGWGRHWGVYLYSGAGLRELRKHLRTFLMVYGPDGKPLYFRYYDPRVLRTYLPTCNQAETETVFGPVARYIAEGEDPLELLRFRRDDGLVGSERIRIV